MREVQKRCTAKSLYEPSEATIRRFIATYATECFDEYILWREGKKSWNDKCAISILRDWSLVGVGDVVIADGHILNFETINPETGKPCRMTLLLFFDGASSHPLGWEIMATENIACISAAFRRTCLILGKFPSVVYIDNGKAFRAKFFKGCADFEQAGFLGLYRDIGCEVIHAWPYHGQSKPTERFFGTMHEMEVWTPSYTGNSIAHKPARMRRGETLHRRLHEKLGNSPLTLEETHTAVARWFCEYVSRPQNNSHLQGASPAQVFAAGQGPGLSPAQADKLTLMMLQKTVRTITKDGFRCNGRLYWHESLAPRRHPVLVLYDEQLSPHEVKVYTLDGEYLCDARDRDHYRIATGIHPAARVLGTAEQQSALKDAIDIKKGQEKSASMGIARMCESVVLPETRARLHIFEQENTKKSPEVLLKNKPISAPTQAEISAVASAHAQGQAALEAIKTYTPSALKRFRDEPDRYSYLFKTKYELGIELVLDDAAWMERFESTQSFQRNYKGRYDALRDTYAQWAQNA